MEASKALGSVGTVEGDVIPPLWGTLTSVTAVPGQSAAALGRS